MRLTSKELKKIDAIKKRLDIAAKDFEEQPVMRKLARRSKRVSERAVA